jgi:HSP20 family molecular chaperone IbpA
MAKKQEVTRVEPTPAAREMEEDFPRGQNVYSPLVDIYELEDGTTVVEAEVPGATKESLDIRVDKGVLVIAAEAKVAAWGEDYARTYVSFEGGKYYRAFALSDEIDRDRIEASMADGMLTLRLPKAAAAQTRKIEVKTK